MDILKLVTNHRRYLHKIPEVSRDLPKTKTYIQFILEQLDCEIIHVMEYGICAYFDRGAETTTAYRADMDALPIQEVNKCEYASRHDGKMHACGHDGHMAIMLAFAQYVDTQKELPCNVLIIFQPAEETTGGAKEICQTGIMQKYNADRVFAVHMWPFSPAGSISSRPGPMMPRSSEISIKVTGKAAHATAPENGVDALFIACRYIQEVYECKEREGRKNPAPDERTIIQICKFQSGTARNIISGQTDLLGTVRAFSDEDFEWIVSILKGVAADLEKEYDCKIKVGYTEGYPPIYNNPDLYASYIDNLAAGLDFIEMPEPAMISEDYSYFGFEAPSIFFYVGTGTGIALHSNNFDFDEAVLVQGVELYKILLHNQ